MLDSTENKTSIPIAINKLEGEKNVTACNCRLVAIVNILHDDKIENDIARDEVDSWSIAVEVNDQLASKKEHMYKLYTFNHKYSKKNLQHS